MFRVLCPKQVAASVLDIDLQSLAEAGITALILDLDNTLLSWDADEVPAEMEAWIRQALSKGFRVCIASNGLSSRVRQIAARLGVPAISKATKPRKRPFKRALELLDVPAHEAAVIGDQVFTDVLGGNRMDIYTILTTPLSQKELRTTRLVRRVERRVLARLRRKGLLRDDVIRVRPDLR